MLTTTYEKCNYLQKHYVKKFYETTTSLIDQYFQWVNNPSIVSVHNQYFGNIRNIKMLRLYLDEEFLSIVRLNLSEAFLDYVRNYCTNRQTDKLDNGVKTSSGEFVKWFKEFHEFATGSKSLMKIDLKDAA